jgi:Tfp pilus assembly protein PilF
MLIGGIAVVFGQVLTHDFVNYDDQEYVYENPRIRAGLTKDGVLQAFTQGHAMNWHPLTTLSHMLDCQLFGVKARWPHAINVLLHTATSVGFLLVFYRMTGKVWPSVCIAALFAVHPLRVESVAWIAERKDVLSGLFFMLTLAAYERYARQRFWIWRYLPVLIFFALGLLSKSMLVTVPFLLLLLDYWPLQRFLPSNPQSPAVARDGLPNRSFRLILEKLPLLLLSIGSAAATLMAQWKEMETIERLPFSVRMANAAIATVSYLVMAVWPVKLAVLYPHPEVTGNFSHDQLWTWKWAGAAVLSVAVSLLAIAMRRKRPWLMVGWFWYLGMLVPVIGVVQVGWQSMADRYTYLPEIGIALALVGPFCRKGPENNVVAANSLSTRGSYCIIAVCLFATLMIGAWKQTSYWKNSETLWTRTVQCTSRNAVAHTSLGLVYHEQGRLAEAVEQYEAALVINPVHLQAHNNLASYYFQQGQILQAIEHYRKALTASPKYAKAHHNLGACFERLGDIHGAIAEYRRAIALKPDYIDAHLHLANALRQVGELRAAADEWQATLALEANNLPALLSLIQLRATSADAALRDGPAAVALARRAVTVTGGRDIMSLCCLGAAYAETGHFPEAIDTATQAMDLARAQGNKPYADLIAGQLSSYRDGLPIRER